MTFNIVNCNGVLMPMVQEPIAMLHLTAKVSSQLSLVPNEKLVCTRMNNCGFETVDVVKFWAML